ncbi:MAG: MFS transporter [Chloroflexota bacterium]
MQRDLTLVVLSMFTWGLGEGLYLYLQPIHLGRMGANPVQIGLIYSALGIAMTIAHIPAGYLSDRLGRRPLMWASWIMGTAAGLLMALAVSLPLFITGLLAYGVTAFVMSPLNSYVTAAKGAWSTQRALTTVSAAYSMGAIIGPGVGGWLANLVGLRQVYGFSVGVFAISTLVILQIRPQPVEERIREGGQRRWHFQPGYWRYMIAVLLIMFGSMLAQPLSSNYLEQVHHLSLEQIGLLGSLASLGVTTLGLTLGRLRARSALLLAQACVGGFTILLWRGNNLWWFGWGYFLMGGYRIVRSMAIAQTRSLVQSTQMGLAYGVTEAVSGIATILAPFAAGILYQRQAELMYPVSLALIVLAMIVSVYLAPAEEENAYA